MPHVLTDEQRAIIHHDPSQHAKVLAVAGSGKTTTMVHRIRHLVEQGVAPRLIRAVMYNKAAQRDFADKLARIGLADVKVQTFHAMGMGLLDWVAKNDLAPGARLVTEGKEVRALAREAIERARAEAGDDAPPLDADDALSAVATWKAMLTPPAEAMHLDEPLLVAVYRIFEQLRHDRRLRTFDDLIYDAVHLLQRHRTIHERLVDRIDHLIIDEFQDVNLARMQLVELLAGERARVMVVGDDDQCIYEWQGARSTFIKRDFQARFTHHPHASYKLTRSFRFGSPIAQLAANVIAHNTDRVPKDLVASDLTRPAEVTLDALGSGGGSRQAIARIRRLLDDDVPPKQIAVLLRKYSQGALLQSQLLLNRIPYLVEGGRTLAAQHPVKLALAYLDVAAAIERPLDEASAARLAFVVQRPARYVQKEAFAKVLRTGIASGWSVAEALEARDTLVRTGVRANAADKLAALATHLRDALLGSSGPVLLAAEPGAANLNAGTALRHLLDVVAFDQWFATYEGTVSVDEDLVSMAALADLLDEANVAIDHARAWVEALDPLQGRPESACICMTTVFRAKGREWDHVLMPDLLEGQIPDLRAAVNVCLNRRDPSRNFDPTETIESERRLFYVAVTRARRSLHLFADPDENVPLCRFVHEARLHETVRGTDALRHLLDPTDTGTGAIAVLAEVAARDAHLREGLLEMLRRASESADDDRQAEIDAALAAVGRTAPAPFAYPHAYPDVPVPLRVRPHSDDGLPF